VAHRCDFYKMDEAVTIMKTQSKPGTTGRRSQLGITLVETAIALGLLVTTSVGVMTIVAVTMTTNEDQGHFSARAAEYAQDKMEQLISLAFGDSVSNTAVFPATASGGTGLAVGGSSDPSAPAAGYVDYLDRSGNPLAIVGGAAPADWFYIRVWQISIPSGTTNLKQITVASQVRHGVGRGKAPQATVATLKTNPF